MHEKKSKKNSSPAPSDRSASQSEFPQLKFGGTIEVVESDAQLEKVLAEILSERVVGFDTESRPSFRKGEHHNVALIQFASEKKAWLLRTCKMGLTAPLLSLLENGRLLKIGASLVDDFSNLRKLHPFSPKGFVDLQKIMPRIGVEGISVRKMSEELLGYRISKRQQLTNWEADQLTPAQRVYAATDAWVCLKIYQHPRVRAFVNSKSS